jgi:hypothetical protein
MGSEIAGVAVVFFVAIPLGLVLGAAMLKIQGVEKE